MMRYHSTFPILQNKTNQIQEKKNSQYDYSEMFIQSAISIERNIQMPSMQSTQNVPMNTVNEQLV